MCQYFNKVWNNPGLLPRTINQQYHRITTGNVFSRGVSIFERDWDNLILLDACRYDLFENNSTLRGYLRPVKSRGTNTIQFLTTNFSDRDLTDTVYVTGNPQFKKIEQELQVDLHAVINAWEDDRWDEEIGTVLPREMTESAMQAVKDYPRKRLVIHYNQPHIPFIGDFGMEQFNLEEISAHPLPFWQQPMAGVWSCSDEDIWRAYRENLIEVLPHVERLLDSLEGKTVVTSDHGNLIGEHAAPLPNVEYGHPSKLYVPELLTVPWLEVENGSRKEIVAEQGDSRMEEDVSSDIDDRLEALGYQ
jgi:hypothetical protein